MVRFHRLEMVVEVPDGVESVDVFRDFLVVVGIHGWRATSSACRPCKDGEGLDGRCKDCKHWIDPHEPGPADEFDGKLMAAGLHGCDAAMGPQGCWRIEVQGFSRGGQPVPEGLLLAVNDDEDRFARLWTAPDFGCVLFEAREARGK